MTWADWIGSYYNSQDFQSSYGNYVVVCEDETVDHYVLCNTNLPAWNGNSSPVWLTDKIENGKTYYVVARNAP